MAWKKSTSRWLLSASALAMCIATAPVGAQTMDHSKMHMPMPAVKKPVARKPAAAPKPVDHAAMNHEMPMDPDMPMDHSTMDHDMPAAPGEPRQPVPLLTDADRAAAFPDVAGHAAHDNNIHSFWLLDRLETWNADAGSGLGWEAKAWVGTDLNRLWLRSEGERISDRTQSADIEVLYGHSVSRWWDAVAGIRHEFGEGPPQNSVAIGVMGLSPYKFEISATVYIGQSGQAAARVEAEYNTLLTNRLILQWRGEADMHGKSDPLRGIGSGLGTLQAGLRLRYEINRRFAPYVGVEWERAYGETADLRRIGLEDIKDTRLVAGVRLWF